MSEFDIAKEALASREERTQAALLRDTQAALAGAEPSQPEAWSLADAYDRLLDGMDVKGEELIDFAEAQLEEFAHELDWSGPPADFTFTGVQGRALVLSSMCVMAQLWHLRTLHARETFEFDGLNVAELRDAIDFARMNGWREMNGWGE